MPVGAAAAWQTTGRAVALRWAYGNADGQLVARAGRLYCARLVPGDATTKELVAVLRDGADGTAAPILALAVTGGAPDDWPGTPVSMGFKRGLYVQFFGGVAAGRLLLVGWETD